MLNLGNLDQLVQDKLTSSGWAAFLHLMKRSWFSRRWIVQEIALAREAYLHCGDESVTWREFAEAVSLFTSKHHDVRKLFQGSELFDNHPDFLGEIEQLGASRLVDTSSNLFRKSDDGTIMEHLLSLEALMSSLSVFEASNPHDIVYAILWLANDAAPSTEEARGSSLNEHGVTHTPQPGSPASDDYSRRASFPFPELRTGRVTNEPAVYNAEGIHASETSLPADMMNEHARLEPAILQDRLAVPNGVQGRKRAASDMSQAPTIRLPGQGAVGGRIVVDYSKTVYEVCKDFLGFVIWQSKSLDIICRPWAPSPDLTKEEELPSWVPKLSGAPFELVDDDYKRVEADPLVGAPGIGRKIYNACGKIRADCHFQDDITRSLFVRGFVLDTVKIKSETAQQGIVPAEWLKVVQWNHGNIPAPDRFWRTLVADRGPDGRRPPPYIYQSACNYAFQRKGLRGDLNIREMIFFGKCPSMAIDFLRRVLSVVWKRSLILTSREEFLGLAPFKAREGDLVCILYGCSVPLVLRKIERHKMNGGAPSPWKRVKPGEALPPRTDSSKSDHYYELIGECYIHGMMDGEAIRHRRLQGLKVEEFELG